MGGSAAPNDKLHHDCIEIACGNPPIKSDERKTLELHVHANLGEIALTD